MSQKLTSYKGSISTLINPKVLEIELTDYCNIRCIMCHVSYEDKKAFNAIDINCLKSVANQTSNTEVKIGVNYEASLHKDYIKVIEMFSKNGNKITLNSNGTKWTKEMVEALKSNKHLYRIAISIDSLREDRYKKIRRNENFKNVYDTLILLGKTFKNTETIIATNLVLNKTNIDELKDFIDFCNIYGIDNIQTVPMVVVSTVNEKLFEESLYPDMDKYLLEMDNAMEYIIKNKISVVFTSSYTRETPLRKIYPEYFKENALIMPGVKNVTFLSQITRHQLIIEENKTYCISPWVYSRIYANGDVEICRKNIIGNLHKKDFKSIWMGHESNVIRTQAVTTEEMCSSCDFYRYVYHLNTVDIKSKNHFFTDKILENINVDNIFKNNYKV